ncbi:MAG: hypothetical protein PHI58_06620 [Candidatus Omnitrophica bacterium]|nr:hypothetical protein [Candidatus Omnitrophota bacterium]
MVGVLEAIKRGFGIAAKSLGLVLALIVFNLIGNLASMPFAIEPGQTPTPQMTTGAIIFTVVFILISIFIQGGALALVRDIIKEGKMKLASFASYGAKYYLKLLGLGVVIVLIIAIVALIAALFIALTAPLNNVVISGIAIAIAIAIGVVASLLYFIPFALSPYALICEDLGIVASMKRSLTVAKKPFSRVFFLILLFVILVLISLGVGVVFGFLVGIISALMPAAASKMLMAVVTAVINGYLGVVMMGSFMVFYLGLAAKGEKAV